MGRKRQKSRGALQSLVTFSIFLVLLCATAWVVLNKQLVVDTWYAQTFKPSAEIANIAEKTGMNAEGKFLFYASQPQIAGRDAFNASCSNVQEKTIVLGCYREQRIYVYDVTSAELAGAKDVTSAHEMLHAVYERLNAGDKKHVNSLLQAEINRVSDAHLQELTELYAKSEPGELLNEMHSILGTEYRNLSPQLEAYYAKYFENRTKVVSIAESYRATFTASAKRIDDMDARLAELKTQIDTNTAEIERQKQVIDSEQQRLDSLRKSNTASYNAAVPGFNAKVNAYNSLVVATKNLVAQYNDLVQKRNAEAVAQNNLYHSLDSQYQVLGN